MFFHLFAISRSVRRDKYRTCEQSNFCTRHRSTTDQLWAVDPDSASLRANTYTAIINDTVYSTKLLLKINMLKNKTAHIKVSPFEKEPFNRYDCELEPLIIDKMHATDLADIEVQNEFNYSIIRSPTSNITVSFNPFYISLEDGKGEAVVFNPDNSAIFETKRNKDQHPELFNENNFNGFNDVFKNGPTSVAMSFRLKGEQTRLSGLPAHTYPINLPNTKSGDPIRFYNTDINEFELNNGMAMYGAVPLLFMHSLDRNLGIFWCNPSETWVDINHAEDNSYSDVRFISESGLIDVYIFTGEADEISEGYTSLTGKPMLTPLFALGYHQCRWGYMTQQELVDVSANLDEIGVPHDVLWLDLDHINDRKYFTFNTNNFPDPKKMFSQFAKFARYVVTLVDPHMKADSGYQLYNTARNKGYLLKTRDGGEYRANCWPGQSVWVDFMNPTARAWWETLFAFSHYKDSAPNDYIWNDMNEISVFDSADNTCPRDVVHYGNYEDREVHNINGLTMVAATWGGLRKRTAKPMRPFILSRSFFAGSQKYVFVWSGDNKADWDHMRNSLPLVMSFGLGGMVYTGSDIGGFFNSPDENLLSRWFSVAAWTQPFFREHCHHLSDYREINHIKDENYRKLAKDSVIERYFMLPYWYTLAKEANMTGRPLVRPLWYEFKDSRVMDIDDQVMLGSKLMIVPFLEENMETRKFVLPKSATWYDFRTLQSVEDEVVPFTDGSCFVLIRGGSIVPMKSRVRKSSKLMFYDPFTLVIAADSNGKAEGKLYVDDGESEEFEQGSFVYRQFTLDGGKLINRAVPPRAMNDFGYKYDVFVERIRICGVSEPKSVSGPTGRLEFEYEDGVLTIRKPNLLIRDDWTITLN